MVPIPLDRSKGKRIVYPTWGRSKLLGFASCALGLVELCSALSKPLAVEGLGKLLGVPQTRAAGWIRTLRRKGVVRLSRRCRMVELGPAYEDAHAALVAEGLRRVPCSVFLIEDPHLTLGHRLIAGAWRAETFSRLTAGRRRPWIRTDADRARSVGLCRQTAWRAAQALHFLGWLVAAHVTIRGRLGYGFCVRAGRVDLHQTASRPNETQRCQYCRPLHGLAGGLLGGTAVLTGRMGLPPPSEGGGRAAAARELVDKLAQRFSVGAATAPPPPVLGVREERALRLRGCLARGVAARTPKVRLVWEILTDADVHPGSYRGRRDKLAVELTKANVPLHWLVARALTALARAWSPGAYLLGVARRWLAEQGRGAQDGQACIENPQLTSSWPADLLSSMPSRTPADPRTSSAPSSSRTPAP